MIVPRRQSTKYFQINLFCGTINSAYHSEPLKGIFEMRKHLPGSPTELKNARSFLMNRIEARSGNIPLPAGPIHYLR